jgi:hypothetical protein
MRKSHGCFSAVILMLIFFNNDDNYFLLYMRARRRKTSSSAYARLGPFGRVGEERGNGPKGEIRDSRKGRKRKQKKSAHGINSAQEFSGKSELFH